MFFLNSSEEAHAFFDSYRHSLLDAVETGIRHCDETHAHYASVIIGDAVPHPAAYRTHDIHHKITARATQLFNGQPDVSVQFGPNHSLVLVFKNLAHVRFQKMDRDFKFPTTNGTQREQDFRNPSANLFGDFPLECVYAAYRLKSSGELRDLYLVGMDRNEGQWFYNVGRGTGEDPLDIPFTQQPVAPVINPSELLRPRKTGS